jgi:hypothetical protein
LNASRFEKYFLGFLMNEFHKPIFIPYSVIKETFDYTSDIFKRSPDSDHFFKILKLILTNSIIKSKKEWLHHNGNRVNDINFYKNDEFCVVIDVEMVKQTLEYALSNPDFN